jgi:hypothetical protein
MNATVTECGTGSVLDWLWAVAEKVAGSPQKSALSKAEDKSLAPRGTSGDDNARHSKRRGELAEAAFLAKAASMGIGVAKPWGDSDRYDFIIDTGARLLKVQIKSAHCVSSARSGGYHIRAQPRQKVSYRPDEIDLLIAYIVPLDLWYIFPPEAFVHMTSVHLFPNSTQKRSRFEPYREAWHWVYKVAENSRQL